MRPAVPILTVTAAEYLAAGPSAVADWPHLTLTAAATLARELAACPKLAQVHSLAIVDAAFDDRAVAAFADCRHLHRLTWLDLRATSGRRRGYEALAACPSLDSLLFLLYPDCAAERKDSAPQYGVVPQPPAYDGMSQVTSAYVPPIALELAARPHGPRPWTFLPPHDAYAARTDGVGRLYFGEELTKPEFVHRIAVGGSELYVTKSKPLLVLHVHQGVAAIGSVVQALANGSAVVDEALRSGRAVLPDRTAITAGIVPGAWLPIGETTGETTGDNPQWVTISGVLHDRAVRVDWLRACAAEASTSADRIRPTAEAWFAKACDALGMAAQADYASERRENRLEALTAFANAIELVPDYVEAWFEKGLVLEQLDRHEQALAAQLQVLSLSCDHGEARLHAAKALAKLGRHVEAAVACSELIAAQPRLAEAYYLRATCLTSAGRPAEAAAAWTQFLACAQADTATFCPHSFFQMLLASHVVHAQTQHAKVLTELEPKPNSALVEPTPPQTQTPVCPTCQPMTRSLRFNVDDDRPPAAAAMVGTFWMDAVGPGMDGYGFARCRACGAHFYHDCESSFTGSQSNDFEEYSRLSPLETELFGPILSCAAASAADPAWARAARCLALAFDAFAYRRILSGASSLLKLLAKEPDNPYAHRLAEQLPAFLLRHPDEAGALLYAFNQEYIDQHFSEIARVVATSRGND